MSELRTPNEKMRVGSKEIKHKIFIHPIHIFCGMRRAGTRDPGGTFADCDATLGVFSSDPSLINDLRHPSSRGSAR
jgi:hypothetical protein